VTSSLPRTRSAD